MALFIRCSLPRRFASGSPHGFPEKALQVTSVLHDATVNCVAIARKDTVPSRLGIQLNLFLPQQIAHKLAGCGIQRAVAAMGVDERA